MCSLQEHIERDIRAREAANQPGRGVTFRAGEHAEDCRCWYSQEHGYVVGASCGKLWVGDALNALKAEVVDSSQSAGKG